MLFIHKQDLKKRQKSWWQRLFCSHTWKEAWIPGYPGQQYVCTQCYKRVVLDKTTGTSPVSCTK